MMGSAHHENIVDKILLRLLVHAHFLGRNWEIGPNLVGSKKITNDPNSPQEGGTKANERHSCLNHKERTAARSPLLDLDKITIQPNGLCVGTNLLQPLDYVSVIYLALLLFA